MSNRKTLKYVEVVTEGLLEKQKEKQLSIQL